jgi:hypothetical protein
MTPEWLAGIGEIFALEIENSIGGAEHVSRKIMA